MSAVESAAESAVESAAETAAQHAHRGVRAVQHLIEHAPGSGALALWAAHCDLPGSEHGTEEGDDSADEPPAVTTDGRTLFYALAFAGLPLREQAGWVAHAVLHVALRHVPRREAWRARRGHVDAQLWNLCADAVVQSALAHLRWLDRPAGVADLPTLLDQVLERTEPEEAALLNWDVERLYAACDDRDAQGRDGRRAARLRRLGQGQAADLLEPAHGEHAPRPEEEAQHARDWCERVLRGQADDGPQALVRVLLADLPRTRTPWEQVLRAHLGRALSRRVALNWSRPSRAWLANRGRAGADGTGRLPWEPGITASRRVPRLVVVADVSGSIDKQLLARFSREIVTLTRRLEAPWTLVAGDDAVRTVRHFEPGRGDFGELPTRGDGGTDFAPLLEEAERHRPDLIVVLTDLDGPAHKRPRCPVLWAVPQSGLAAGLGSGTGPARAAQPTPVPPFGQVLALRA
ncbi:MAG: DUF2201 family putative metallopeptidase [Rubrivivax sp.]